MFRKELSFDPNMSVATDLDFSVLSKLNMTGQEPSFTKDRGVPRQEGAINMKKKRAPNKDQILDQLDKAPKIHNKAKNKIEENLTKGTKTRTNQYKKMTKAEQEASRLEEEAQFKAEMSKLTGQKFYAPVRHSNLPAQPTANKQQYETSQIVSKLNNHSETLPTDFSSNEASSIKTTQIAEKSPQNELKGTQDGPQNLDPSVEFAKQLLFQKDENLMDVKTAANPNNGRRFGRRNRPRNAQGGAVIIGNTNNNGSRSRNREDPNNPKKSNQDEDRGAENQPEIPSEPGRQINETEVVIKTEEYDYDAEDLLNQLSGVGDQKEGKEERIEPKIDPSNPYASSRSNFKHNKGSFENSSTSRIQANFTSKENPLRISVSKKFDNGAFQASKDSKKLEKSQKIANFENGLNPIKESNQVPEIPESRVQTSKQFPSAHKKPPKPKTQLQSSEENPFNFTNFDTKNNFKSDNQFNWTAPQPQQTQTDAQNLKKITELEQKSNQLKAELSGLLSFLKTDQAFSPVTRDGIEIKSTLNFLKKTCNDLTLKNLEIEEKLEKLEKKQEKQLESSNLYLSRMESGDAKIKDLEIELLEKNNLVEELELRAKKQKNLLEKKISDLENFNQNLRRGKEEAEDCAKELRVQVGELEETRSRCEGLGFRLNRLETDNENLRSLVQARNKEIAELEQGNKDLVRKNDDLRLEVTLAEEKKNQILVENLEDQKDKDRRLAEKLEQNDALVTKLKAEIKNLEKISVFDCFNFLANFEFRRRGRRGSWTSVRAASSWKPRIVL